jgi:hypothetical protein
MKGEDDPVIHGFPLIIPSLTKRGKGRFFLNTLILNYIPIERDNHYEDYPIILRGFPVRVHGG